MWWHVPLLVVLCVIVYFPGLDALGVYAWQEGQRLIVAREMNDRLADAGSVREAVDVLLLPTAHATPYIAKPPVFYWLQIIAARLSGSNVELWHIRLVVALCGTLGVIATYFTARSVLRPLLTTNASPPAGLDGVMMGESVASRAALWSGITLAAAPLWAHAARIGEVDIALAMFCTVAIGAVVRAWRSHIIERRTNIPAVVLGTLATAGATLTKDPGVFIVAIAAYGGVLWYYAVAPPGTPLDVALLPAPLGARGREAFVPCPVPTRASRWRDGVLAALAGLAGMVGAWGSIAKPADVLGAAVIGAMCALLAFLVGRLSEPFRFRAAFVALSRTHPVAVLGIPIVLSVLWRMRIAQLIGTDAARALVNQEVDDNLRALVAEAPLNNVEALAWGCGLASAGLIFGLIWYAKDRPRLPALMYALISWIVLPLVAFSLLGKGVQRYLTPVWPGVAIVAGLVIASLLAANPTWRTTARGPRLLRATLIAGVLALSIGQLWFFAFGRVRTRGELSPRDFVAHLRTLSDVNLDHLVSINFSSPALAYYAGQRVEPVGETGVNSSMSGGEPLTFDQFTAQVCSGTRRIALIRAGDLAAVRERTPLLQYAALEAESASAPRYLASKGDRVEAFVVTARVPPNAASRP